jgi:hypothetical protein
VFNAAGGDVYTPYRGSCDVDVALQDLLVHALDFGRRQSRNVESLQRLQCEVGDRLKVAVAENDLIYHDTVVPQTSLAPLPQHAIARVRRIALGVPCR